MVLRGIIIFELDYVCGDCVDLKIRKDAGEGKKKSDISLWGKHDFQVTFCRLFDVGVPFFWRQTSVGLGD